MMHRTKNFLFAIVALSFVFEFACIDHPARAADLPDYMKVIVGDAPPASATDVANQNVLALDLAMFGLYDDAQAKFQKNFLSEHPIILALFSNQGGKLTLVRPGKPPLDAPQVPIRYQIYKSVGHSSLAVFELAGSHLGTVSDLSWVGPMRGFRDANQVGLDSLDKVDLSAEARENQANVLKG